MSDTETGANPAATGQMPINIHAQYIRDLSFENPLAPHSLRGEKQPEMDINIGMDARDLEDDKIENLYEVVLNVRATAKDGEQTLFIAEVQYGITVSLNNVPEDQHHPLLLIEIPRLAFPYVRQILTDVTSQSGFPPLMLAPFDFHSMYVERFKDELEASQKEAQN